MDLRAILAIAALCLLPLMRSAQTAAAQGVTSSTDGPNSVLRVVWGVTEAGEATDQWLAMLRKRLSRHDYDAVATLRKPLTTDERAWGELILSRAMTWEREIPTLAELFRRIRPPGEVLIVIGNRGPRMPSPTIL